MLNVEKFLISAIASFDKMGGFVDKPPYQLKPAFELWYIGEVQKLFPIEIKKTSADLGWLYSKSWAVSFKYDGQFYFLQMEALKEFAEAQLKTKVYEAAPKVNCLMKIDGGGITGYLDISEVIILAMADHEFALKENPQKS